MQRKFILAIATAAILGAALPALAQKTGLHGGMLGGSGAHQTELVVSPTELTVYLIEDGKAHDTKGAQLRAIIQQSGKTTTVNLAEQGKRLVGMLAAPLEKGAIVVVSGKDSHGDLFKLRHQVSASIGSRFF